MKHSDRKTPRFADPHFGTFAFFQRDGQTLKMQKSQNFPAAHPCGIIDRTVQTLNIQDDQYLKT